jgi:Rne/Rng family ribonuclease
MIKEMIVHSTGLETKVAILEEDQLAEFYIERNRTRGILGNIYKGRVTKVLPGMQSAFVNIGLEKDAFLYVSDFIEDTEEFDKVFTEAEKQAETVMAETEVQERAAKRERRPERPRWRERREREEARPAVAPPSLPGPAAPEDQALLAHWALAAETAQSAAVIPGPPDEGPAAIPAPIVRPPAESQAGGEDHPEAEAPAAVPLDQATLREPDETMSCAMDALPPKGGPNLRRRGPGARRKRFTAARHNTRPERQSIDQMLHEGQEILVQVAKEPIAKKGARVTSHVALPGRYLVYMPTVDHIGVSRKISSEAERVRLRDVILKNRSNFSGGVIVRTAAEERSAEDLVNDLTFLARLWEDIRNRMERISAPALVHSELNLVQRLLRDQLSFEFASIRVNEEVAYQGIVEFVDKIYPNLVHRVKLYTRENPILDEYGVTAEIDKLLQPKIWLKSGGYIVINQTEALVSIDVNTGKFVGKGNSLEETITRTNLEAVKEIVKQVRLRDLGGIIVIDFIDMDERKNRKKVMEALSQEIARDKSPSKILEFNEFGLVAITRKRVRQSLERTLCQPCPYCAGSGMVKSVATTCYDIYQEIERMAEELNADEIMIRVHPEVAKALRESEAGVVEEIRHLVRGDVIVKSDPTLHIEHFNIVA